MNLTKMLEGQKLVREVFYELAEELCAAQKKFEWISVKDDLPVDPDEFVPAQIPTGWGLYDQEEARYNNGVWYDCMGNEIECGVSYWFKLPEFVAPEEEES